MKVSPSLLRTLGFSERHGSYEAWAKALSVATAKYQISTPLRLAHFLAQLGHESRGLYYVEEVWGPTKAQRRYEPPSSLARKLGNTEEGDGYRYRGRGPIQATGRDNYRRYSADRGIDFEANPDLLSKPEHGIDFAGWYWEGRRLNALADKGPGAGVVKEITKKINGGYNGLEDRQKRFTAALRAVTKEAAERAQAEPSMPVVDWEGSSPFAPPDRESMTREEYDAAWSPPFVYDPPEEAS